MYIITLIVALVQMSSSTLTGNAWIDLFLDKMVGIEGWFLSLAWWVWGIALALTLIVVGLAFIGKLDLKEVSLGCGCLPVILLAWPLLEWLSLVLIEGMATSFDPVLGVVNAGKFVICLVIYLILGAG